MLAEQRATIAELQGRCASLASPSTTTTAGTQEYQEAVSTPGDSNPTSPATAAEEQRQQQQRRAKGGATAGQEEEEEEKGGMAAALEAIGGIAFTRWGERTG